MKSRGGHIHGLLPERDYLLTPGFDWRFVADSAGRVLMAGTVLVLTVWAFLVVGSGLALMFGGSR